MYIRVVFFLAAAGIVQCELINLKCEGIRRFVDGHNWRRRLVAEGGVPGQPAAADMTSMVWDEELAAKAAKWAGTQKYGHNQDRTIPSGRFLTGENIYIFRTTDSTFNNFDADEGVASWFHEHEDYHYKLLEGSDFEKGRPQIGHYTQMVWSDTTHLGCAVAHFKVGKWFNFYVVCNYGPPGNYLGSTPYKKASDNQRNIMSAAEDSKYGSAC